MDVVFPKKNEQEIYATLQKLGYKEMVFCYTPKTFPKKTFEEKGVHTAVFLEERNEIAGWKKKAEFIFGPAQREFFEDKRIAGVLDVGLLKRKDHTHFRKSITQVEDALATKNNQTIYFCLRDIIESTQQEVILGRWMQDKHVCKKANCVLVSGARDVFELRSRKDLENFWKSL